MYTKNLLWYHDFKRWFVEFGISPLSPLLFDRLNSKNLFKVYENNENEDLIYYIMINLIYVTLILKLAIFVLASLNIARRRFHFWLPLFRTMPTLRRSFPEWVVNTSGKFWFWYIPKISVKREKKRKFL